MSADRFPPLGPEAEGLQSRPAAPVALARRMAEVWGVRPDQVLPVRGALHGLELVFRRAALDGARAVVCQADSDAAQLAHISRLELVAEPGADTGAVVVKSPCDPLGIVLEDDEAERLPSRIAPALLVVDETHADVSREPSMTRFIDGADNLIVLKSLSGVYGLAGARVGAVIAQPALIERLRDVLEPLALPAPSVKLAEAALSPSRAVLVANRIELIRAERERLCMLLEKSHAVARVCAGEGPYLFVEAKDPQATLAAFARFGVNAVPRPDVAPGGFRLDLGPPEVNDRALAALGCATSAAAHRRAELTRETKETKISVVLDLDASGKVKARTGIGFYDHMLEQIAFHGGFDMDLACSGDLEIDAHHTVEDCALAFGAALKEALGAKRGIARFGFVLPMDETEAKVSIDLGGRPFAVFEGAFTASHIGEYPTEMTAHVFRSFADSLGAAIHVTVSGENDHHKTEACFKAFGRTLRQAIRVEGLTLPSTKGVI
ncbi:MAG TPA: imidazoleglycerol-phosphate dehydratase HisB [Caulobacteraceae bacterium]|jgi:imidazoleglycerol phosphate dehydratase HisB/histidinol-phosphate/aromatic aminotransferase/cobyric acid decarboxylase-like protein